jgi:hypothetical protein
MSISGIPTADNLKEQLPQLAHDGPHPAASDLIVVNLNDRSHLHTGATEKDLVGQKQLGAIDRPLDHLHTQLIPH